MPKHPTESWVVTAHGFLMPQSVMNSDKPVAFQLTDLQDNSTMNPKPTPLDLGPEGPWGVRQEWWILGITTVALLVLDAFVFRRLPQTFKSHLCLTFVWLLIGLLFNVHVFVRYGKDEAIYWLTGYFLEWMLSADNLCVFSLILTAYRTPPELMHKALFFGLLGCIGLRLCFFLVVSNVMNHQVMLQVAMGVFLVLSGLQGMMSDDDDDEDIADSRLVKALQRCLGKRLEPSYDVVNRRLFVVRDNRVCATLLVLVILLLELTDVMFALDSVSAKIAAVPERYTAYSSTVFAVFGLRAAFFILHSLTEYLEHMKKGIAFVVVFIGVQLILARSFHFPAWSTCAVSTVALSSSAIYSCYSPGSSGRDKKKDDPLPEKTPEK